MIDKLLALSIGFCNMTQSPYGVSKRQARHEARARIIECTAPGRLSRIVTRRLPEWLRRIQSRLFDSGF